MRHGWTAFCLLSLAACNLETSDTVVPEQADIARLEAKLSQHPCIGSLDAWERNYRYSRKSGFLAPYSLNPDLDVIEFHLRRAGTITIAPGRKILRVDQTYDWPDSATVHAIEGRYKLANETLEVGQCTPMPPG